MFVRYGIWMNLKPAAFSLTEYSNKETAIEIGGQSKLLWIEEMESKKGVMQEMKV